MASSAKITVKPIDTRALAELLRSPSGGVARELLRRGKRVETAAKKLVGVDSGRLRASITTELVDDASGGLRARTGTNVSYARYHHDGTGIYGPRGRPIVPVNSRFLRFTVRGVPDYVYARSVRGSRGTQYLKRALDAARG